jgi:hypothetical protein
LRHVLDGPATTATEPFGWLQKFATSRTSVLLHIGGKDEESGAAIVIIDDKT